MKNLIYLVTAMIALGTSHSFAAKERGGGDVLVCTTATGVTYELLDFYEARTKGWTIDLGDPSLSVDQKLEFAVNRFETRIYEHGRLREQIKYFNDQSVFLSGVTLVNVDDSKHIAVPNNCTVEQGAIQREPTLAGESLYYINQDLWSKLDNSNRAGLILHELIYKFHRNQGETDSIKSRFLVGLISSSDILKFNVETLMSYIRSVKYDGLYREGNLFYKEHNWIGCIGPDDYVFKAVKYDVEYKCPSDFMWAHADTRVDKQEDGFVKFIVGRNLGNELTLVDKGTGSRGGPFHSIVFKPNGELRGMTNVYPDNNKLFTIQGKAVCLTFVSYYPNMKIYAGDLCPSQSAVLMDTKHKKQLVRRQFYLDEAGALTKWDGQK